MGRGAGGPGPGADPEVSLLAREAAASLPGHPRGRPRSGQRSRSALEGDTEQGGHILVVDDNENNRDLLARRLERQGYRVSQAEDGRRALDRIASEPFDLVLLDIMMPHMKGRDVCAFLKANPQTKHIPVIFLTALALADHIKAGMDLGAEDYIVKPFEPAELRDRIQIVLARHEKGEPTV